MMKTVQFQGKALTQEEAVSILKERSVEGLKQRYGAMTPETLAQRAGQISYEIDRFAQAEGFLQRFLVLWDLTRYAKERQIPVSPVSGSLSSSLAAYCLGITGVDPLQHGLLFDWFLVRADQSPAVPMLGLSDRGLRELSAYLAETYAEEQSADLLYENYILSRMDLALQLIAETSGERPDLEAIDLCDKQVFSFLAADGWKKSDPFRESSVSLEALHLRSIEELAAAFLFDMRCPPRFDLYCPDPLYESYLEQARRSDPLADSSPFLRSITSNTRGCILYEEQAALVLQELTGCSLEQAAHQVWQFCMQQPEDGSPAQLMEVPGQETYFLDLVNGVLLQASPDGQLRRLNTGEGDPAPLLEGPCWQTFSKCSCIPPAILLYRAAYLQCYYPDAFQKACEAVPDPYPFGELF